MIQKDILENQHPNNLVSKQKCKVLILHLLAITVLYIVLIIEGFNFVSELSI